MHTYKQKYEFLLSQMKITNVDLWEQDALIEIDPIYFQFAFVKPETTEDYPYILTNEEKDAIINRVIPQPVKKAKK
jgi:hypothetical protein